jgi:two-component system, NtrC family, response regulator AtoC
LPELERQALREALQREGWNVTRAARALGISRDTLRYRIEKFGLADEGSDEAPVFRDSQR